MSEKLQKVLARAGYASRRKIEEWIQQGRIQINNKTATLGDRVNPNDTISIDGAVVPKSKLITSKRRVIIYNKPVGQICSRDDPDNRPTIFQSLPDLKDGRWISVGRLDFNTSGLLILTNDGELANALMHPSTEIEREYAVRVLGDIDGAILEKLKKGVLLEDGYARFTKIIQTSSKGANDWFHVVLREGRNREVRRLWESQGLTVSRLLRIRFGPVRMHRDLKPGQWKDLSEGEINSLIAAAGLPHRTSAPRTKRNK
jgi:23S rRNA pseudouridine2605 synthase